MTIRSMLGNVFASFGVGLLILSAVSALTPIAYGGICTGCSGGCSIGTDFNGRPICTGVCYSGAWNELCDNGCGCKLNATESGCNCIMPQPIEVEGPGGN
jgi:hypothetical protein